MNGGEFLELENMYSIMVWRFPVWYYFSVFWVNRCVFPLSGFLRNLRILLSFCLSIRFFRYVFWGVAIFESKIVRFLLHPVVGMFFCHLQLVGRIFFRCFGKSYFVSIVLPVSADFFICVSSRISHPGFDFLVLFEGIRIFLQPYLAAA